MISVRDFDDWRRKARRFLRDGIPPEEVSFTSEDDDQPLLDLPEETPEQPHEHVPPGMFPRVPSAFLETAKTVACHTDRHRWDLLYRILWRLTHGEPELLDVAVDDDIHKLNQMERAVSKDAHKAKAFVRFRRIDGEQGDEYVAWHRPDHHILKLVAPFFSRRFPNMHWSILTPDESVLWDGQELHYGPGVPASEAPDEDHLEDLWRTYYGSIFNPARIKLKTMKREMPVRHWATLPETRVIPQLLEDAPRRVAAMHKATANQPHSVADFLPDRKTLRTLAAAAKHCEGCDLYKRATQTVFGEGSKTARIIFVGEQPGDQEDLQGHPFVGPAGRVLDEALLEAGIDRSDVYVTNAVKHFHWEPRGERRLHKKPPARAMAACKPWLEAEVKVLQPEVIVCLGATAAQSVIGREAKVTRDRGKILSSPLCEKTLMTWHPSAVLRAPDATARAKMRAELVHDLKTVARAIS
ncbi:DNA polymerase [Planctomyces sp. SCGC AG-212-M04]|nr:DNA polymerase [Planctomyces sp. SCGC AG-212-M04]